MITSRIVIATPKGFHFWHTVYSHGWCVLPPFYVDRERKKFGRLLRLHDSTLVLCWITSPKGMDSHKGNALHIYASSKKQLTKEQRREIASQVRQCFRLDEDFSGFYALTRSKAQFRWISNLRTGRLLRAPTVFEDVVKMICTTNCSWALTTVMIENLTKKIGRRYEDGVHAFPTPEELASVSEKFLRKEIRAGYRSPYLLELAEKVAGGQLDIESLRSSPLPTPELYKHVRSIKGIGEYAAGNILKLLGRYDYLGLDSWVRRKFSELHRNGRKISDRAIERHYAQFGQWRGLLFWLEMTRDWYDHEFPF